MKQKVLVVGQTPPPYHGQAIMIETMLNGRYANAELVHIRMDFSESINEVGTFSLKKVQKLLSLILQIIHGRFKHKTSILYYPPAGDTLVPIIRDIFILLSTRFLFKKTLFHFHASGLIDGYKKLPALLKPMFKLAYNYPDLAITLSTSQPPLAKFLKSKESRILPNGIPDDSNDFRRTHFNPIKRILFVGAVRESKGVLNLLQAANLLKKANTAFQIDIVGEFTDTEFKAVAQSFLQEHSLQNNVIFHGLKKGNDKWSLYKECDIFCFPTFYENEAFPVVLLEALSFSLPMVVTNWRGCPDIVTDKNGYIIETESPESLAHTLITLINDDSKLQEFADANRKRFLQFYSTNCYYKNLDEMLLLLD